VKGFPTKGVIAPDGTLVYAGYSAESALSDAMADASKSPLWPKKVNKVAELASGGQKGKAYAELRGLLGKGGLADDEQKAADKLLAWLEGEAQDALDNARKSYAEGHVYEAVLATRPYAAAKPPFPVTEDAASFLAELEALPSFKGEMKGGELFAEGKDLELSREYLDAFDAYKKIVKKYGDAKIAEVAREAAEDLMARGMPGYEKACPSCMDHKRACDKHLEAVRL